MIKKDIPIFPAIPNAAAGLVHLIRKSSDAQRIRQDIKEIDLNIKKLQKRRVMLEAKLRLELSRFDRTHNKLKKKAEEERGR